MQVLPFSLPLRSLIAHLTTLGDRGKERGRVVMWCGKEGTAGHQKTQVASPLHRCHPMQPWPGLFSLLALVSQLQNEGITLAGASGCPLPALKIL